MLLSSNTCLHHRLIKIDLLVKNSAAQDNEEKEQHIGAHVENWWLWIIGVKC